MSAGLKEFCCWLINAVFAFTIVPMFPAVIDSPQIGYKKWLEQEGLAFFSSFMSYIL